MADEKRHLHRRSRVPENPLMREKPIQMRLHRENPIPRRNRRAALSQIRPSHQRKKPRRINPKRMGRTRMGLRSLSLLKKSAN